MGDQMRPFSPDQREEFERIALVYHEVLLRVACRILRSESLAEDAVQEVACLNESVTSPLGRFADIATAVTTCRRLMLVTNSLRQATRYKQVRQGTLTEEGPSK